MDQQPRSRDTSVFWPPRLPLVVVICLGTLFSLTASLAIRWWEHASVEKAFLLAAEDRAKSVKGAFDTQLAMMEIVRSALIADGRIERTEFAEVLRPFLARSGAIWAVEWVPRVPDSRRSEFEAAAQRDGIEGFRFAEQDAGGQFVTARQRDEYFPIYFIGPLQDSNVAFGYDLASEAVRFAALQTARDTGKPALSGPISFIQDKEKAAGFFVCLPIYAKDQPTATTADRRKNLTGFILGVFRPNDMMASALKGIQPEGIDFGLYDPSDANRANSLFYHASRLSEDLAAPRDPKRLLASTGINYSLKLDVAGHPWTIVCAPTAAFDAAHRSWWAIAVFVIGLAFTFMVAGFLLLSILNASRLEDRVYQQTADIRSTQQELLCRLASASQWCDEETPMHIRRMGVLSEALARRADWLGEDADAIRQAAPMHDIGKIGIPDAILQKTEPLTPEEIELLKTHTRIGAEILAGSNVPLLKMAREIAYSHHERWDGNGYPRGLSGKDIPESARIVAIIDAYDTLTHDGANRSALAEDEVLVQMQQGAGRQFDPQLLAVFLRHLSEFRRISEQHPDRRKTGSGAGVALGLPLVATESLSLLSPT